MEQHCHCAKQNSVLFPCQFPGRFRIACIYAAFAARNFFCGKNSLPLSLKQRIGQQLPVELLAREQGDAGEDKDRRDPPATIDILTQEESCSDGIGNEGQGSCGWRHQAHVRPRERGKKTEESNGHEENAKQKGLARDNGFHSSQKSRMSPNVIEIAHVFHGTRGKNVSSRRGRNYGGNHYPG